MFFYHCVTSKNNEVAFRKLHQQEEQGSFGWATSQPAKKVKESGFATSWMQLGGKKWGLKQ